MTTKLFVANLGWSVTENDLFNIFSDCGEVLTVKIPLRREDGRSRGFAFIEMGSADEANRAIQQLNNMMLYNRPISVVLQDENHANSRPAGGGGYQQRQEGGYGGGQQSFNSNPEPNNKLFVRNVNSMVSEEELTRLFQQAGDVVSVKIPMDRETGMARGFAFVEMGTVQDAQAAITQLDSATVYGQVISVNFQDPSRARAPRPAGVGGGRY
jgi:nucleolin